MKVNMKKKNVAAAAKKGGRCKPKTVREEAKLWTQSSPTSPGCAVSEGEGGTQVRGSAVSVGLVEAAAPGHFCLILVYPIAYPCYLVPLSRFSVLPGRSLPLWPDPSSSPHRSSHLRVSWRSGQALM